MKPLIVLAALVALAGCEPERELNVKLAERANQAALTNTEVIGRLEDGRDLIRYELKYVDKFNDTKTHFVYVAGPDVTVNHETGGKSKHNEVQAQIAPPKGQLQNILILDGQRLDPDEVRAALVLQEDTRRKNEQRHR